MATIKTEKSSKPTRDPIADTTASRTPAELLAWIRANACTGDELAALAGQHVEVDRVLASHPQASAALLSSLSHSSDRATRSRVAANPDTPAADILRLGQQFPKEILANPALDLLLLENPALMEHVPESLLVRLLKQAGCPASLLTWAAARPEVKVQLAVAMNSSAPAAALERLRQSSHEAVVEATRARGGAIAPDADPEKVFEQAVRERLSSLTYDELQDAWSSGDIGLAQWTALSLNQRLIIATYSDFSGISPAAIARLLRDTSWTLTTLKELLPDCACWGEVAEKPATPLVVLEALSTSKLASERAGVAANPSTPVSILECLSRDPKSVVRRAVAKNPSIPLSVISGLSNDSDSGVRASVAGNESCPSDLLAKLAMDSDSDVRAELAANTVCPEEILDVLSRDSSRMVVRNVARNPSTPVKILEGFFRENKDPDLYPWLASNPSVPVSVLEILSRDEDDPDDPNPDADVRQGLAENTATPQKILIALTADKDAKVKEAAFRNSNLSIPRLLKFISSKNYDVRRALASQAHRSEEIRKTLWNDADMWVRATIARCPEFSEEVLDEMAKDVELEVELTALLENPSLSPKTAELIANKLFNTPATSSAWYRLSCSEASDEVQAAVKASRVLSYPGKDPKSALLAKRPVAPLMALCAGPFFVPSQLARVAGSHDWLVRAAVARNPGVPPNLLKKLRADPHPVVVALAAEKWKNQFADPSQSRLGTPDLKQLDLGRVVGEVWGRLCKAFARQQGLGLLFQTITDAAWSRQTGIGHMMSALGRIHDFQVGEAWRTRSSTKKRDLALSALAKLDPQHRAMALEWGAKELNPSLRLHLAMDPKSPLETIREFTRDENAGVLVAALANPTLPSDERESIVQELLKLRGSKLVDVLHLPDAPLELLRAKVNSSDRFVQHAIASNPAVPAGVLEMLYRNMDESGRASAARSRDIKSSQECLAGETAEETRGSVGPAKSSLPPEFERLSNHPEAVIALRDSSAKEAIASHPSTSVAVLEALAGTNDDRVLAAVAGNPSTPVPVLEALALDSRYSMWAARRAVAGNPSTPAAVLESLSCDTSPGIRSGVAESLSAPTAVLARLAGDLESAVRGSVARNPSTPADVLERLSKDTDSSVRGAVATNPSSTETVLSVLAGDSDWQVPMLVALNPSVSVDLRERYLQAWADRIQRALQREISIRESGASSSQVSILPADLVRATTWLGLIDPDPDNKALTKASRSKDWLARLSVALHPQSTEGILRLLAKDADADVAAAARLPRSSLGTMAATPSSATAATASGHPVSALPDAARTTGEAVLAAPAGAPLPDPVTPAKIEVSVTQSDPSEQIPAEPTQNLGASTLSASRKICISGKLPSGKKKADYEAPLRAAGFELVDEVVKGLAYLVLADPQLTTSKSGNARKLGIPVISEADLAKLVG